MQNNLILRALKTSLIVVSSVFYASCQAPGSIKVYNIEAYNEDHTPGLVRREKPTDDGHIGKIIEVLSLEQAHNKYGCMSWDDINELLHRMNLESQTYNIGM